ncbi:short-chain dehydrogenase [Niastella yeongjuensis]|uniref:Short-chain dehydrogenase n=1 Tax=Niastella yeongjuensis TaxID=354355 RepID=A0A1V9E3W4_9BACT|nr:SDR family NAD(P)-dependent oxidoreductase [Niastella yeongjuensis]OQP40823.1 short-chain dehydrogenase [Niastella yeongjuensis]SEP00519.1 NAD(P)-dependent dehydrogenase, short-chain alcohol dehydrogenase family [Niastella yeongjuensis]
MDLQLQGKRALITGSSAGLGEAIAIMLADEGATVIIHGRNPERAAAVASSICKRGGLAEVAIGDLSTDTGADEVGQSALAGGPVDILVNNAGAYEHFNWTTALPAQWLKTYETNVLSGVRMIQRLLPQMRARKWGRIITIGGGLATQPVSGHPEYSATLSARHNLAVSLARELKGSGVTSNVVAPGAIRVKAVEDLLIAAAPKYGWGTSWEEIEKGAVADIVQNDIGRLGKPEEIAGAVAYLVSSYADYISGATIRVDGGTVRTVA